MKADPLPNERVTPSKMYLPKVDRWRARDTLLGLEKTREPLTALRRKEAVAGVFKGRSWSGRVRGVLPELSSDGEGDKPRLWEAGSRSMATGPAGPGGMAPKRDGT